MKKYEMILFNSNFKNKLKYDFIIFILEVQGNICCNKVKKKMYKFKNYGLNFLRYQCFPTLL